MQPVRWHRKARDLTHASTHDDLTDVLLEPFELLGPQRAEAPRFEVDHVHQADAGSVGR
jgi:hypothetical protein